MTPVNAILLDGNEQQYGAKCIRTGCIFAEGPLINQIEERFAASVGRRFDWKEFEADFSVVRHRKVLGELFSSVISSNLERLEEGRAEVKAS
jgi:hypothetical protein